MTHEILFAGFGGQGVLSMGTMLAYAGMLEGKEVSWMPSYGPEMRGGTANCIVIISTVPIRSPIVTSFDAAVVMNQPSLDKFEKSVKPNGLLLYDSSGVFLPPTRTDITVVPVPVEAEVRRLGSARVKNTIVLGALLSVCQLVHGSSVVKALPHVLPERYHNLLDLNKRALERGERLIVEAATPIV